MRNTTFFLALQQAARQPVIRNRILAESTSLRIGGPADYFCSPPDAQALRDCVRVAQEAGQPYVLLGGGTNILFHDAGFRGVVISTLGLHHLQEDSNGRIQAEAGLLNSHLTQLTLERGLTGFEWAAGLPGSIGGGVAMNARCYGRSFSDLLISATALTPEGEITTLSPADCAFGNKKSIFQLPGWIIISACLQLEPGDPEAIRSATQATVTDRQTKGQFTFPSAGCVFKNDYARQIPAGRLIETCGLKGQSVGGACVYTQHANFIINTGQASSQDVLALIERIETTVWEKQGIRLEKELRIVPDSITPDL